MLKFDGNIFSYTGNNKTFLLKSLAEYWASNSHNPVKLLVVHLKEKKKEIEVESEKHKMPQFISPEFLINLVKNEMHLFINGLEA